MKFYISKGNLGGQATREQADKLIQMFKGKGWDGFSKVAAASDRPPLQDQVPPIFFGWECPLGPSPFSDNIQAAIF